MPTLKTLRADITTHAVTRGTRTRQQKGRQGTGQS